VGLLGCEPTLLASFSSTSTHKSFSAGLLSIPSSPACIDTGGCPDPDAGLFAFGLVEPHEIHTGLFLKLVQIPLHGIPSF